MVDRVIPLNQASTEDEGPAAVQTLWIRLPDGGPALDWLKRLVGMFPGKDDTIIYLADRGKKLQARCLHHALLLQELAEILGQENVVVKKK